MKSVQIKWMIAVCLVAAMVVSGPALAAQKVMVITGISQERAEQVGTYQLVYDGISELLSAEGITPEFMWVDLDTTEAEAKLKAMVTKAVDDIEGAKPDVLISLADTCLKYVVSQITDIPVVFSYVFSQDMKSFGLPRPNVTGVTRRSYAPDIWGLAKQVTGANTVALLSKHSIPMENVRKYLLAGADKLEKLSGVRVKEMYMCNTFDEWKNLVTNWKEDLLYLADTSRIEKDGKVMDRADVVKWTVDNAKVPVLAATEKDTEAGGLFSIVTSENQMGRHAAELTLKILNGTPVKDIPIQPSTKGKLLVNGKTAEKLGIEFPYEILSTADKIYE